MPKDKKQSPTATLITVVIVVVVGLMLFRSCDSGDSTSTDATPRASSSQPVSQAWNERESKGGALVAAQNVVKGYLNYPSSAKFESAFWVGGNKGIRVIGPLRNQEYSVTSWVDAQNAFGATIRTEFIIYVKQVAKDRWEVMTDSAGNPRVWLESEGG